ncbi:MAG TPA: MFS transporter [Chloroflexota bacterium]
MVERVRLDSPSGKWIIAATSLGSGMIFLDGTVVNVALPAMQRDLLAPLSGLQWIVNSYTLLLAAFLMLGGGIGDAYGRKTAFIAGMVLFTLASVLCGLAPNLGVLVSARALQGIGGALLVPGSLAMIKAVIVPEDSSRAIGLWAGLASATTAVGPLLGGYLVDALSWRAIFFINVPLAVVTLYATARYVPPNRDESATRDLDWPGAFATVVGLGGLTYALIEGPAAGWQSLQVIGALVAGALGCLWFPLREARAAHPMVPPDTWRSRNFTGANLATLGVYFSLSGVILYLVLRLQQVDGYTPLASGAALLPVSILILVLSPRVGALMGRFGARPPMIIGPVVVALGLLLFIPAGLHPSYLLGYLPGILLLGLGMSVFVTPLTATVMASVPEHLVGVASGVSNTLTRVASLLAIAILGLVIVQQFGSSLTVKSGQLPISPGARSALIAHRDRLADDPIPPGLSPPQRQAVRTAIDESFVEGYRWAMATCALLCLLSAGISAVTIRDVPAAAASAAPAVASE